VSGIRSTTVGYVWLVWDGFGGCVFEVCETKRDAKRVARFYNRSPRIHLIKFPVRHIEALHVQEPASADPDVSQRVGD
jgi:hypothetical protein